MTDVYRIANTRNWAVMLLAVELVLLHLTRYFLFEPVGIDPHGIGVIMIYEAITQWLAYIPFVAIAVINNQRAIKYFVRDHATKPQSLIVLVPVIRIVLGVFLVMQIILLLLPDIA